MNNNYNPIKEVLVQTYLLYRMITANYLVLFSKIGIHPNVFLFCAYRIIESQQKQKRWKL